MQLRSVSSRRHAVAAVSTSLPRPLLLPWQAAALALVLTLGAIIHTFPFAFRPLLSYAYGMSLAAVEWQQTQAPDALDSTLPRR